MQSLRCLINNKYEEFPARLPVGSHPPPHWSHEMVDWLETLLKMGADPTQIPKKCDESVLYIFFKRLIRIMNKFRDLTSSLMRLLPFFTTEECMKHCEAKGTALHALLDWDETFQPDDEYFRLCHEMISKFVSCDPSIRNKCDARQRTALHMLAKAAYQFPEKAKNFVLSFQLITNKENVNAKDEKQLTPYSWILIGKARWEDKSDKEKPFTEIEKIFFRHGADEQQAVQPLSEVM